MLEKKRNEKKKKKTKVEIQEYKGMIRSSRRVEDEGFINSIGASLSPIHPSLSPYSPPSLFVALTSALASHFSALVAERVNFLIWSNTTHFWRFLLFSHLPVSSSSSRLSLLPS